MRLCRPSFQPDPPLRLHPLDLIAGEDLPLHVTSDDEEESQVASSRDPDFSFRSRFHLQNPIDAMALSGLLILPQAFGAIYLGETFCSYISINNSSNYEARDIVIKAEIQTERQRMLLFDTSNSPVESIRAGGRYDFIIEHDVKELGPHTLVCSALYNDGDSERKYLPQFFKFVVANPLSVRTKVRSVKGSTFLETCIENHTKSNLLMDQVEFEPAPNWTSIMLTADENLSETDSKARKVFRPPVIIKAGGGIHNFLYQLCSSLNESSPMKVEGSNVLGKLQITWRTNLGEPGRLQTQQILGSPIVQKNIHSRVVEVPSVIIMHVPFSVHFSLTNQTDRKRGPFEVHLSENESNEDRAVMVNGIQTLVLPPVEALGSTKLSLNMVATKLGVQKISGITVFDVQEKNICDSLPDVEIFVYSD
ncbi:hypothetical protein QJS10_CPB18g01475 [Acorus calamus]|uniref:Trafficking protein particle complex subunit 13 n=1 Tax=Acorus calamus TaxID=4465 RepID=A0AAV9CMX5_ACOCL|nr:hypothetical protein QJS10_CPB18g01475 [Acorus calamus]